MARPDPKKTAPRVDVTSPAPALKHSPFAALAGASAPASPEEAPAAPEPARTPPAPAAPAPAATPPAPAKPTKTPSRGRLVLRRETKHRGGKTAVLISGFAGLRDHGDDVLGDLAQRLKQRLGCGGSIDAERREILIQGDRPADVAARLRELGYDVAGVTK